MQCSIPSRSQELPFTEADVSAERLLAYFISLALYGPEEERIVDGE
jgi:hypothetical protein